MKIAFWHFYTFRMRRGIEVLTLSLANALAKKGQDVSIVTASPLLELFVKPDPKVKIFSYPTFKYFEHISIVPFYFSHFQRYSYDAVIVFFSDFGEGLTCQLLRPFQKLPLVLYLCYPYSSVPHRYESFVKLGWDKNVKQVMADAKWIADEAAAVLKRPIFVLPVGTDPEHIKPNELIRAEMRRSHGYSDNDIVLLNVAALEQRKGTWRVIDALGRLKHKAPQLKYYILGKGNYEKTLKNKAAELGLEDRVVFGGETDKHFDYYNMADIFIMLPDAEANSLASIEAMSAGLPSIISSCGGFRESVPEDAGIRVDIEDSQAIDAAILRLAQSAELRRKMGRNARDIAVRDFSWDSLAERFLKNLKT